MTVRQIQTGLRWAVSACVVIALTACGSSRPKPAELTQVPMTLRVEVVWSHELGRVRAPLVPSVQASGRVTLANDDGELLTLQLSDGKLLERVNLKQPLSAGVGSDGVRQALVTQDNQLIVTTQGKVAWTKSLSAQVYTPPLVAGERVFVLLADRTVQAYDGQTGRLIWTQSRPGDPLVLRQAGTLMAFQNTLVAGLSGRLSGFDPTSGKLIWDAPLASPRGLNDLERLVDIVGLSHRSEDVICARAYLAQVGCVNARRGQVVWSRNSQGDQGLSGLGSLLVGVESNGLLVAWLRDNGDRLWESDQLKYRRLSAPLVTPKAVWVADEDGQLYLLDPVNGKLQSRVSLDGSELAAPPLAFDDKVLVVTRKGLVRVLRAS
jgi:outer membrane protein assembly factor BamB